MSQTIGFNLILVSIEYQFYPGQFIVSVFFIASEPSPVETFDVTFCRSKLAEHYKRTATVPTSVWSKTSPVDIHQIYTRLSLVKKQQTLAGSSQSQLHHYTHVFSANKDGVVPKRILVQGQTGIGKSTFVKKLAVDWAELDDEKTGDVHKASLEKFELVLVVNLKEASKCQSFRDVLRCCNIFLDEEATLVEGLLSYITKNQEKVLLVFDGYDEYRCGRNSDIYEIFRGKKLRNCRVLITTRISKANDLLEFKDKHAEITGFSKKDREAFMYRMLGDQMEVSKLKGHLSREKLTDLTRVPLLLLFFCILWKNGRVKSFSETKAKLYLAIVQYVLDYSQGKSTSGRFGKVQDFNDILCEIGNVALECLLKDDHVFEYDQLSAAILSDENRFIGLLQVTEYAENLRPAGMVSFIHKSVQEFLAAWYITYICVPEGNLGEIEQRARTLEDCKALENVLQFICSLSEAGAANVFQHLASVRISDSELKLLRAVPTEDDETEVPLCNGTDRQRMFSNLVFELFGEVDPKDELLSNCFDCLGGVVLVPGDYRSLSRLLAKMKDVSNQARSVAFVFPEAVAKVYKSLELLDCLHVPLRLGESSKLYHVGDFLQSFVGFRCGCRFRSVLFFRNGKFQFYITGLELHCDHHATLLTETNANDVSSVAVSLCSDQSCLEFLTSLHVHSVFRRSSLKATAFGWLLRNCKYLKRIVVEKSDDSVSELLEHVADPSECSLKICSSNVCTNSWLLRFNNIVTLDLDLGDCRPDVVDTLVGCVTHKTLERLALSKISLTPVAAAALGRSLPEMSSLEALELTGKNEVLQAKEIESLLSGFSKAFLPLYKLIFRRFITTSCLPSLTRSFRFFPSLKELHVGRLIMDERNTCALLDSLKLIPNVEWISLCNPPGREWRRPENTVISSTQMNRKEVELRGIILTPAVAAALGRSLPKMSSLETLVLSGVDGGTVKAEEMEENGSTVQAKEMEALFGGFNKALPLYRLIFTGFCVRGCLAPLIKSLPFFPNLTELFLGDFSMDAYDLCGLMESLRYIPNLRELALQGTPLCHTHCCSAEVNTVSGFTHMNLKVLELNRISLTPAAAAALGRSLPEMSSLETLVLTGMNGSTVQAEGMEALFGGFTKTLPLRELTFSGFNVRGCLAPLTKSFRFFTNLRELCLEELNMDEHDQCGLLESFGFIASNLPELRLQCKSMDHTDCHSTDVNAVGTGSYKRLEKLEVNGIILTAAAAMALGRSLSEMSSLQILEFTGENGSILQAEEMEALFSGFNKVLPLYNLTFRGFSVSGCLAPLTKSLQFFPNLTKLLLKEFSVGKHELCSLVDNLRFVPKLRSLSIQGPSLSSANCCTLEGNTFAPFSHTNLKELILHGVSLTPASAAALGGLLPEISSLETLVLTEMNGSTVQAEEMEVLFGGLNKTLPLRELTFNGFNVRGCLAPLTNSFRFFPDLRELNLEELNMDEHDQCGLLENFGFFAKDIRGLKLQGSPLNHGNQTDWCNSKVSYTRRYSSRGELQLNGIRLTPSVIAALGRLLPEMSSLEILEVTGANESVLQAEEMEALFGGLNQTLPLHWLTFSGFSARGCLAPLSKSFRFFPRLTLLDLDEFNMDDQNICALLEGLAVIRNNLNISLSGKPLRAGVRFTIDYDQRCGTTVCFCRSQCLKEDMNYVKEAFKQVLPRVKFGFYI